MKLDKAKKIILDSVDEDLVKDLLIELLEEYAKRTDNEIDDRVVGEIKMRLHTLKF